MQAPSDVYAETSGESAGEKDRDSGQCQHNVALAAPDRCPAGTAESKRRLSVAGGVAKAADSLDSAADRDFQPKMRPFKNMRWTCIWI